MENLEKDNIQVNRNEFQGELTDLTTRIDVLVHLMYQKFGWSDYYHILAETVINDLQAIKKLLQEYENGRDNSNVD